MHIVDLKEVKYPKSLPAKVAEENVKLREQYVEALMRGDKLNGIEPLDLDEAKVKAAKRFPKEIFDPIKEFESTINDAMNIWIQNEHWDKEKKQVQAPWEVRKMIGRITNKIMDSEDGTFELSDEQLDFLVKVLQSNLPYATYLFYVGEYFEQLKSK